MSRSVRGAVVIVAAVLSGQAVAVASVCPSEKDPALRIAGIPAAVSFTGANALVAAAPPTNAQCIRAWNLEATAGERRAVRRLHAATARIGQGGVTAFGVSAPTCEIDFIVPKRDLARLRVTGRARLHVSGPWKVGQVSSWFGGIRCGPAPPVGPTEHSQSIISGQPIVQVRVTSAGLLRR